MAYEKVPLELVEMSELFFNIYGRGEKPIVYVRTTEGQRTYVSVKNERTLSLSDALEMLVQQDSGLLAAA